jgi:8-oxo-dGTP pyrophosphatase MutT (NUDIX family)
MEKEVYKGHIIKVTEEKIEGINWERVYLPSGVIIYPINEKGQILMIEEKRPHENPPHRIKPVSGILELDKGTSEENAQREMQEEIGFRAEKMELFWTMNSSGTVNTQQHFYIAKNLIPSKLPNPDGEDTIMGIRPYGLEELREKYLNDEIKWSMSTLGFFRLYQHLKNDAKPL